jgi:hypothetical protein
MWSSSGTHSVDPGFGGENDRRLDGMVKNEPCRKVVARPRRESRAGKDLGGVFGESTISGFPLAAWRTRSHIGPLRVTSLIPREYEGSGDFFRIPRTLEIRTSPVVHVTASIARVK